ncbi:hypothetical protein [Gryllotalpicola protaetiae]|uniref:AbrB/MazE/SpoVT family DNA-binding domain-containing protein n=1 Tax=Gryllotalpicola protaetiae TaxID=2419771 RepID=A0A387BTZ5_9MICO|nr:hypothetical protein [Gryllotalpicola protaetiae]AYG05554.1 hypothetical protein D7I44_17915 [Gryllotalpicola protaetiae]
MTTIAQLDGRKRLNLAPYHPSDIYIVTAEDNGRITLEPATVVSALEQRVLNNPAIMAEVSAYHDDPTDLVDE